MNTKYTGKLEKGDFIAISYTNYIQLAFYIKMGRSLQFYSLNWLASIWDNIEKYKKLPLIQYINSPYPSRVMKIDPRTLQDQETEEKYEKAILTLKHFNIIND